MYVSVSCNFIEYVGIITLYHCPVVSLNVKA